MPEELVFTASATEENGYPYVHLKSQSKIKRGEKEYHYWDIGDHWGNKQFGADVEYDTPEIFREGTRFARPIMSSYGGYECFAKDIPSVIDCIEQKFGVKVKIEGAPMNEVKRIAQLIVEESVAPKPQEIGLFEIMESNSEQVLEAMKKDVGRFCTTGGVGRHLKEDVRDFATKTCKEVLEWLANDLDLETSNEDWSGDLKYGGHTFQQGQVSEAVGRAHVKRKLQEILERDRESAEFRAEEKWGVAPREPYKMGEKDKAQKLAKALIEPFNRGEREFLNSIGDETARKLESDRLKDAIRLFLNSYLVSMKRRVEQLR